MQKCFVLIIASLLFSCSSSSSKLLNQKVDSPIYSQILLRNLIEGLDEASEFNISISPRLNKVVDLWIDRFPHGFNQTDELLSVYETHQSSLVDQLDYICNFVFYVHKVQIEWRLSGSNIEFVYAGSEEEYTKLRKLDE